MSQLPTPAIYFHPDAIESKGKDLVGRRSAGQSFLKGWLRVVEAEELAFVIDEPKVEKDCRATLKALGETRPTKFHLLSGPPTFAEAGAVFFPTPGYMSAAWMRQRTDPARCSLIGITHTVSTRRVMEAFHSQLAEPVEDWDAVICTSNAVRSVVARQLEEEEAYYRQRFGASRVPKPQLPVIPLGIETADFAPQPGARERLRGLYDVPEDGFVVMTMGRLSVIEKANPLPLMLALEYVAQQLKKPIHLWLVGWSSRDEEGKLFRDAAAGICKNVTVRIIDGRQKDTRRNIWAAADVFSLPADSIQETFGLVPVEAMAAGLPVVMPDWDGFRDTVIHGETGILVPTRMVPPGGGVELAARHIDRRDGYLQYLVQVQSGIQIDVPYYAQAFLTLFSDAELRKRMGAAAMKHARETLDWSAVVPRYLDLTADLAERRKGATASTPARAGGPTNPLEIDPFDLYSDYPTKLVGPDDAIAARVKPQPELIQLIDRISGRDFAKRGKVDPKIVISACDAIANGAGTPAKLAKVMNVDVPLATRLILQLAKADLIRFLPIEPRPRDPSTL